MTLGVQRAIAAAGAGAFRAFLESKETAADVVFHEGELYRFKYASDKTFGTLWGQQAVSHRVFQNASDTKTHVPLDAAWGMAGETLALARTNPSHATAACGKLTPAGEKEVGSAGEQPAKG